MSELNKCYDFNKTEINDNEFQYHTDKDINRIGVMATNTLNLSTFSKGLILNQDRERKDKVAIQTFIYKIRIKSRDIFIENVYITPDTKNENLQKLISHLQSQSKKFKFYMVGGDFNLNWRDKKIKDLFRSLHLHQVVKQYTRVQNYKKKIRDVDGKVIKELERTSKTIIDLVYAIILLYFKEYNDIPMSTTWVFVGLLCGRELAISTMNKDYKLRYVFPIIGKDFLKMIFGLSISVGIVLSIHYIFIPNGY